MEYKLGDWYVDDNGTTWEMSYDIDNNVHRWFDVLIPVHVPRGHEVEAPAERKWYSFDGKSGVDVDHNCDGTVSCSCDKF